LIAFFVAAVGAGAGVGALVLLVDVFVLAVLFIVFILETILKKSRKILT
jgi:hypothetical protein